MKSKIGSTMLGVAVLFVCAGFGIADDGELLAFDKVYENPQAAVNANAKNVIIPETSPAMINQESAKVAASEETDRLLVMKDWLKDLPAGDRAEFLGGLMFLDGQVVSIYTAPLKRTASKGSMDKILAGFAPAATPNSTSPNKQRSLSPLITISELLKDVPADVRTEFLEKMVLKNGAIVSMYLGGLKKVLPGPKVVEIVNALKPGKSDAEKAFPKTLCGNGDCYDAICSGQPGHRYCIDYQDYTCTMSCYHL